MKICTIIGARPQFIKAAAVSRAIAAHNRLTLNLEPSTSNIELRTLNIEHSSSVEPRTLNLEHRTLNEVIVHTGQHYDDGMSAVFFRELEIPEPKYNLAIGSGSHGAQTGQMLAAIEKVLIEEKPDWVLIYGDTNSTLAGALAAAKLHIPIAHVEAGLRSFNRRMPEEINRVVADQLSTLLLCPSQVAVDNLAAEGIGGNAMVRQAHHDTSSCPPLEGVGGGSPLPITHYLLPKVIITGDVMADALQFAATKASAQSDILNRLGLQPQGYLLATVHRAENTDDPKRLSNIMAALSELSEREPVILPLHPRTRKILERTSNLEHRTPNFEQSSPPLEKETCPPLEGVGGGSPLASRNGWEPFPTTPNLEQSSNIEHRTLNLEQSSPPLEKETCPPLEGAGGGSPLPSRNGWEPFPTTPNIEQSSPVEPRTLNLEQSSPPLEKETCPPLEGVGGGISLPSRNGWEPFPTTPNVEQSSNREHRTLNLEHRTLNVEHRTLNLEHPSLRLIDPLGYFDIIALEKSARMLLTDSGGMQKEAYWLKVPCITLRDETEWVETVESGWNILTGADRDRIITAVRTFKPPADHPPLYGDGQAAEKIIKALGVRS